MILPLAFALIAVQGSAQHRLTPLPLRAAHVRADRGPLTFVVCGDNRAAARGLPAPPSLAEECLEIRLLSPAFVLWTGDSIYGSDDTIPEAGREYDAFLATLNTIGAPVFNAPGNHEIFARRDMADLYTRRMGPLYGSVDIGSLHIVALDTDDLSAGIGIGTEQMAWLSADLEAMAPGQRLVVFMHRPIVGHDPDSQIPEPYNGQVRALIVKHPGALVFQGHEHLLNQSVADGVTWVVTGGGGAPADEEVGAGGALHYLVVTVADSGVSTTVLEPWRLVRYPVQGGWIVANYNRDDVAITLRFPPSARGRVHASWTYKGKSHPLAANETSDRSGVSVRVTVPGGRAARIATDQVGSVIGGDTPGHS